MYDVMEGVRVIEVAEHTFVPAAGMILADWGADVIKIERRGGDAARHLTMLMRPGETRNAFFEVANRGKRSIGLDLTKEEGRQQLYKLIADADVFLTNLRTSARQKMGIEPEQLMEINPRLVYARGTGYGTRGAMAESGGFDFPSSWCRSGSGFAQTPADGGPPPTQPGSVGDLTGGATLAGAISAALFRRERSGKGAIVDHALYMMGTYIMTQGLATTSLAMKAAAETGEPPRMPQGGGESAAVRLYKTKDDRWLNICFLQDAWFPDLFEHLDRPDLASDPRFKDAESKMKNAAALIAELEKEFAKETLAEWGERFATLKGVWAPLQNPPEVLTDEQALENGFIVPVRDDDGEVYRAAASPGQFDERPVGALRVGPHYAQHTDDVMRELGLSQAEIEALREQEVIV
jgi:crotonobetainyl-CoA:carnitine CoA-transferase CaiB-like acyl-CoA transferase